MKTKNIFSKLAKDAKAFSPIVAVLMLVLVSVGSAGAFFIWQSGWQGEIQTNVAGNDEMLGESYLRCGGSSTIYPVLVDAAQAFMADNPQITVEVKTGGSGSGRTGAALGYVDIGASSSTPSDDYYDEYPDMVGTIIGYDAVVPIVNDMSAIGLKAIDDVTLSIIYGVNGLGAASADDCLDEETTPAWADIADNDSVIKWDEVPTYPGSPHKCNGSEIIAIDRSDISGTEECFHKKLANELDDTLASDHQIACGGDYGAQGFGNQGVISEVAATENSIGFCALGLAPEGNTVYYSPAYDAGASFDGDTITEGTRSGIPSTADVAGGVSTQSRTLWVLTKGEPEGLAGKFVDYILWTENNFDFLNNNGYVSIYD